MMTVITKAEPKLIFRTERLYFRTMTQEDFSLLCQILQDEKAMYAYEHAFSDEEVREWLNRQLGRYEEYGFGLWTVSYTHLDVYKRQIQGGTDYSDYMDMLDEEYESVLEELEELEMQASNYTDEELSLIHI